MPGLAFASARARRANRGHHVGGDARALRGHHGAGAVLTQRGAGGAGGADGEGGELAEDEPPSSRGSGFRASGRTRRAGGRGHARRMTSRRPAAPAPPRPRSGSAGRSAWSIPGMISSGRAGSSGRPRWARHVVLHDAADGLRVGLAAEEPAAGASSKITTPREYTSERRSTARPLRLLGRHVRELALDLPGCVRWRRPTAFATPKSVSLTRPS